MHDHHEHTADCSHAAPAPTHEPGAELLTLRYYPSAILDIRVPELAPFATIRDEMAPAGTHSAIAASTLLRLQNNMLATLQAHDGIGLAANQCGVGFRLFVTKLPNDQVRTYLNPEIIEIGDEEEQDEGCLSFPGFRARRARPTHVVLSAIVCSADYETDTRTTVQLEGLAARCAAHEMDHLNGVHYGTGLGPVGRNQLYRKVQKARRR
jgi:peptide deformylase